MYLEEQIYKDLTIMAKREKKSMAGVTREILKEGIQKRKEVDTSGKQVLQNLLNMRVTGGPRDLSLNHDSYLYGGKKEHE